jgi:hypothetical protein
MSVRRAPFLVLPLAAAILAGACMGAILGPQGDAPRPAGAQAAALRWFKGNTHTHTLNSDGDSSPGEVSHWYRDHGYDFLVLSDHNYFTVIDELQREFDRERDKLKKKAFLLIPGEEVTDSFKDEKREYAIHVNGVNTQRVVGKQGGASVAEVLQRCADGIRAAGGMPHINHPNYLWSLTVEDIYSVQRLDHFEIFNGHPSVHNFGGGGSPSLEEIWDALLSRGRRIFGIAVDDAHSFKVFGPEESNPGRGWVVVKAAALDRASIVGALARGDFYSSTGVELEDVAAGSGALSLRIKKVEDFRYRTEFIGKGGKVLKEDASMTPTYTLRADDLYVRARVRSSAGEYAWTQPLFRE